MTSAPLQKLYDLSALSQAGAEILISPTEKERADIARFVEVEGIKSFRGHVTLKRQTANRFLLSFVLDADIVQACVVTLEPVESKIALAFERELKLAHTRQRRASEPENFEVASSREEGPEDIESPDYDLVAPLLEELVLAIEPYPRAPGAEFAQPAELVPEANNPFSVLKNLKKQGPEADS